MPREMATSVFVVGILGLFVLARDRESRTSPALWISVVWVSIASSRMVSQWLQPGRTMTSADQYLDGSLLDRVILAGLLAAGVMVLLARGRRVQTLLRANGPILLFFLYC